MPTERSAEEIVRPIPKSLREMAEDERITDENLIAMATTCSSRYISLGAETVLRMRYPSRHPAARIKASEAKPLPEPSTPPDKAHPRDA